MAVTYRERLSVPLRWWVQGAMCVIAVWLAMVVALPFAWSLVVAGLFLVVICLAFISFGSATIRIEDDWLHAGPASVQAEYISAVRPLDRDETREVAGPKADARAHLLLRPYRHRAVQVFLADPADPTPYWLLSTRRPQDLSDAVNDLLK